MSPYIVTLVTTTYAVTTMLVAPPMSDVLMRKYLLTVPLMVALWPPVALNVTVPSSANVLSSDDDCTLMALLVLVPLASPSIE